MNELETLPELCPDWCDGTHDPIIEPADWPGKGADGHHRHTIGSFPVRPNGAGIAVSIERYVALGGTFITTELGEPCIELEVMNDGVELTAEQADSLIELLSSAAQ